MLPKRTSIFFLPGDRQPFCAIKPISFCKPRICRVNFAIWTILEWWSCLCSATIILKKEKKENKYIYIDEITIPIPKNIPVNLKVRFPSSGLYWRTLPDIKSCPEVRKIYKIRKRHFRSWTPGRRFELTIICFRDCLTFNWMPRKSIHISKSWVLIGWKKRIDFYNII